MRLEGVIREGVYMMLGGPNYETVAELKMLREMGVDSVGSGTIQWNEMGVDSVGSGNIQ